MCAMLLHNVAGLVCWKNGTPLGSIRITISVNNCSNESESSGPTLSGVVPMNAVLPVIPDGKGPIGCTELMFNAFIAVL